MKPDVARGLHRRMRLWIVAAALVFGAGIAAVVAWQLRESYDGAIIAAQQRGQHSALLLARGIEASFRESDLVMRDVLGHLDPAGIRFPDPSAAHYEAVRNVLREKALSLPYIYGIGVANRDCVVSYAANEPPGVDIRRRSYCMALRDHPEASVHVSGIYQGQQGFLQITRGRKIRDDRGNFAGIVLMRMDTSFFDRALIEADIGAHGVVAVADTDLNLAARKPALHEAAGKTVDDPQLRKLLDSGATVASYRMRSPFDGRERVYSARRLDGLPLVVVLGIDVADMLADWKGTAFWGVGGGLLLLGLLVLATRHYLVSSRQADALSWQSAAVEASGDAVVITDARGVIEYVNPAFVAATGFSKAEAVGRRSNILKSGRNDESTYRKLWTTISAGQPWRGELVNRRRDGVLYTNLVTISPVLDAEGIPQRFVAIQHDITHRKRMEERMAELAQFDSLTGLPNRALFADRLERAVVEARRDGRGFALLYIDLDGFKAVNDEYGHETGDALLVGIGRRFSECLREADTLGRLGGDEFAAILRGIGRHGDAGIIAAKMIAALAAPLNLLGHECRVGASIGIALHPDDGGQADVLLRHADLAMYEAKRRGKNRWLHVGEVL